MSRQERFGGRARIGIPLLLTKRKHALRRTFRVERARREASCVLVEQLNGTRTVPVR
jgi:hypothetical protein